MGMAKIKQESNFLKHEACPKCKSKDNLARYDDGHAYCYSCEARDYFGNTKRKENNIVELQTATKLDINLDMTICGLPEGDGSILSILLKLKWNSSPAFNHLEATFPLLSFFIEKSRKIKEPSSFFQAKVICCPSSGTIVLNNIFVIRIFFSLSSS